MTVNVEKPTRRRAPAAGTKARKRTAPDSIAEAGIAPAPTSEPEPVAAPSSAPGAMYSPPPMLMPSAPRTTPVYMPRMVPGESMTIGEIDQTVFDCPTCSRPLAVGARRCPGCSARLLNGVVVSKVTRFVAAGLAIGLVVGTGAGFLLGLGQAAAAAPLRADGSTPPASASASGTPSAAVTASPTSTPAPTSPQPSVGTGPDAISPAARAALVQTIGTNDRLATARDELKGTLGTARVDASEIARILRGVSADSVHGGQLASRLAGWSGSTTVASQLATFYDTIHDTAVDSLVSSVRDTAAYRSAATAMVRLLTEIPAMDDAIRAVAGSAGVSVPAPALPVASAAP